MRRGPGREEPLIDSPRHALVLLARALEGDSKSRARHGLYIAWGLHLAQEALDAKAPIAHALAGPRLEQSPEGAELLARLRSTGITILRTTTRILEAIVPGSGDQGVLMLLPRPNAILAHALSGPPTLVLAAHGVQDPGNLGSIVRTSLALGAGAVLALEGCADPLGSRAVRAAMGAHFRLQVVSARTADALHGLSTAGLQTVAADPAGRDLPQSIDLTVPTVLLVGNEGAGLPRGILDVAQQRVRIPMAPGVSSINVHAAAAILLYETARQRGFTYAAPERRSPRPS